LNVLAVGSHPDDIELGCFGTLAKHHLNGDKIFGTILTNGEISDKPNKRRKESEQSAKLIKMKLIYGNFKDGNIPADSSLVLFLDKIIKKHKIDVVYTHTEHDRHQDHRNVAAASISSGRNINELYSYETPSVLYPFNPQLFVDITKTIEFKTFAIKKHGSQKKKIYMRIDAVKGLAKFRAYQCRIPDKFCEAFEVKKVLKV